MSDHDPNGDDDFLMHGPHYHGDDSNPMHQIGYGRGDDMTDRDDFRGGNPPSPRTTQAYSFIDPQRIINVGERTVEPTIPMEAVEILSVKDIIHRLTERNLQAWRALPEKIRDRMLERPQDFQLVLNKQRKDGDFDYNIVYSGTVWRYHGIAMAWVIADLI